MKKYLFILLLTIAGYGQTYQNPTFGTVTSKTAPTVTTTPYLGAISATGVVGKIVPTSDILTNESTVTGLTTTDALDYLNSKATYTTPEEYGAIGNGIADDKTAIQNAINSGKMVLLNGNYFTSGTITISNKTTIYGNGKINTTADLPIFDIKSNDIVIDGIRFEGNGRGTATNYVTTRPLQIGVNLEGVVDVTVYKNIRLSNLYFYNLGGAGIKIAANKNVTNGGNVLISNCSADLCYIGYYLAERGEYNSFSNIKSYSCEYGMYFLGGNNPVSNPNMERNRTGMYFASGGVNSGHSSIIGGSINHPLDKGIDVNGFNFGQSFIGVQLYASDIYITGSDNIKFTGCDIRATNIIVTTSTNTYFQDCSFIITPTVFTGLTLCTFSSTKWLLTPPSGFTDTNEQPLKVVKKLVVNTGTSGANLDIVNQNNGSLDFSNSSGANAVPTITGKSNDRTGISLIGATNDANTFSDFSINIRENDNTDFTTLTSSGFKISRFGTTLMDMLRNGNTSFTGNISAPLFTGSAVLTGNPTAPTPTAGDNDTSIANTAFVTGAIATAKPYKVYTAKLTQTGTSAPTVTYTLENTVGTITWTRNSTGTYYATSSSLFVGPSKCSVSAFFGSFQASGEKILGYNADANTCVISTTASNGTVTDGLLSNAFIEIRVYQ